MKRIAITIVCFIVITMLFTACGEKTTNDDAVTTEKTVSIQESISDENTVITQKLTPDETTFSTPTENEPDSEKESSTRYPYENTDIYEQIEIDSESISDMKLLGVEVKDSYLYKNIAPVDEPDAYEINYLVINVTGNSENFSVIFENEGADEFYNSMVFLNVNEYESGSEDDTFVFTHFEKDVNRIVLSTYQFTSLVGVNHGGEENYCTYIVINFIE